MQTIYIQGQTVIDDGTSYEIFINKPIYGHCVALNSDIIKAATRNHRLLLVKCPEASELLEPQAWVKKAARIAKVFRRPNDPMILYQAWIGDPQKEKTVTGMATQLSLV